MVVNAALVVYTFNAFDWVAPLYRVRILVALVGVMLLIMTMVQLAYPDTPHKTQVQLDRQAFVYSRVIMEEVRVWHTATFSYCCEPYRYPFFTTASFA